jgi:hypothetical protein
MVKEVNKTAYSLSKNGRQGIKKNSTMPHKSKKNSGNREGPKRKLEPPGRQH